MYIQLWNHIDLVLWADIAKGVNINGARMSLTKLGSPPILLREQCTLPQSSSCTKKVLEVLPNTSLNMLIGLICYG